MNLAELRREYMLHGLVESELDADPFKQFDRWFHDTVQSGILEPNAMTLATSSKDGRVHARTVLLKHADSRGFVFFTNYESRKGRDLDENPHAALVFPWIALERQVCVSGTVVKVSREETEAYFATRPEGSRLGAWASDQSRVIAGREEIERKLGEVTSRFAGKEIPAPPHWGGFRVMPETLEFWQGRANRLHDRLRYRRDGGAWVIERLSP